MRGAATSPSPWQSGHCLMSGLVIVVLFGDRGAWLIPAESALVICACGGSAVPSMKEGRFMVAVLAAAAEYELELRAEYSRMSRL
jgi:hypothetical protein